MPDQGHAPVSHGPPEVMSPVGAAQPRRPRVNQGWACPGFPLIIALLGPAEHVMEPGCWWRGEGFHTAPGRRCHHLGKKVVPAP